MTTSQNPLRDGWTLIVKRECATCVMIVPVIARLTHELSSLTVYTQDDPKFPEGVDAVNDLDLAASWHADIEAVPTLIFRQSGVETARTAGWVRKEWRELTGIDDLGSELPEFRPGCGSMSVDPEVVDKLRVRFGG
ncbi:MAG: thioredoxin family protein, partial [Ilumatobacteraceae bacterium]